MRAIKDITSRGVGEEKAALGAQRHDSIQGHAVVNPSGKAYRSGRNPKVYNSRMHTMGVVVVVLVVGKYRYRENGTTTGTPAKANKKPNR